MQKSNSRRWRNAVLFLIALLIVTADQLTKLWIRSIPEGYSLFEVGFFRITRVHNTGAAFGLFQGQSFTLTIVALVGITLLLFYALFIYRRYSFLDNMLGRSTIGLILGGTLGNLVDRIRFGYVTDFIGIGIWPAFNVADAAITIGAIVFAYSLLCLVHPEKN